MDSNEGRVMVVMNGAKSSLVFEVKEKQDQDPILRELKANVHKQKVMAFQQGEDGVLKYQGRLCYQCTGLPRYRMQHDSIWVIVHRMTKSAYFLLVKTTFSVEDYAKLYIQEIKGLGLKVNLSIVFHSHTNGQVERTIQTLEDMLRACVINFKGMG
ncbi:hypothetical protein MTR67_018618 [Solanum verrucosum]|uniref:Integrase catalytic domain-containing protein n=1 Tax=Solanum verrucosum TaxID=315347 RepID=A0AAF0QMV9_SOLVR|nr:hypothetical protein MTR67_018618 [Solanum verrucosum]